MNRKASAFAAFPLAITTFSEVAPCRIHEALQHVHPEMRGEVSTETLPPPAPFIRHDVVVYVTGEALKATAGHVTVR